MCMSLVSIILPTYNGSCYLDQAVRSCIDQTYTNWELIIVDDASTDDTPALIAEFMAQDVRVRSVRHDTNRKLPAALNTGFRQARGDYLTWTSDDNCYRPNALAEMVSFLEGKTEIDFVYTDFTLIDKSGRPIKSVSVDPPEVLGLQGVSGGCFLYRRIVQKTLGSYDEALFLAEDLDFWVRALISFKLEPLHKDLYLYRDHDASLTRSQSHRVYRAHDAILRRHSKEMYWMTDKLRAHAYLRLAKKAMAHKDMMNVFKYLMEATVFSPRFVIRHSLTRLKGKILQDKSTSSDSPI
jgi:glycosyltransferase involved in cell wall biosynthesis